MAREIVLDTETTGIDPRTGHRLVELACVEVVDLMPTGVHFHRYIDPERDSDPDAERVHGLTRAFLRGKPRFAETHVCEEFLAFVQDSPIVAHNAAFDRGFVNHELVLCGRRALPESQWVDSLPLAQKRFPGMHNSLDALCKRFKISLAERTLHGALIDARLLAAVYLELCGGRERGLDFTRAAEGAVAAAAAVVHGTRPRPLRARVTDAELEAHAVFVATVLKDKAVWVTSGRLAPA